MRYTVNYCGAVFTDDKDDYNYFETNSLREAKEVLYHIVQSGADVHAYLKDEDLQYSLRWDEEEKEFYWEC